MKQDVPQQSHAVARSTVRRILPSFLLFLCVLVAVVVSHGTLLRLPYFWDEGGYYIPAAWDFWRVGTLIPQSTMSNAHPPLPMVLLAGWWKLTGFHILSTRLFLCIITSIALLAVYRLARNLAGTGVALTVMTLTAVYPIWFAQSTLAHADMFAAAATLWGLALFADRQHWNLRRNQHRDVRAVGVAICFSLAALSKETAIVVPAGLFCLEAFWFIRSRRGTQRNPKGASTHLQMACGLAFPFLPLLAWYAYHRAKTGFIFGNPEYLRYNATANLSAARVLLSLWHRLIHLTVHMELFVPVLLTLVILLLPTGPDQARLPRKVVAALVVVLLVHWLAFSILGGALLTRYLLPAYPVLLLLCVSAWKRRTRWWPALAAVSLAAFVVGCEVNPPYPFAPEDNLAYRDMIVLHQAAIDQLQARYPGATVLSAWPVTADLQRPELGYLHRPFKTVQLENFTAAQIAKAAQEPGRYDVALVFSTKYHPSAGTLNLSASLSRDDMRYFDAHRDLLPAEIARLLGGGVVWQAQQKGQWAALIRFNRSYDASLHQQMDAGPL